MSQAQATGERPEARGLVVAIDGPSGSGKSTISKRVAARLGLAYLDTGAMFRAAAWWCRDRGVDLGDGDATARAVRDMPLRMVTDPAAPTVFVGVTEVEPEIRSTGISAVVSSVATNLDVRAHLLALQREIIAEAAAGAGIVAEGRDVTTVVAPQAQVRVLLAADAEARLARRTAELYGSADVELMERTRDLVVRRDEDDATVSEFFTAADGVVRIDTSALSFEESYEAVYGAVLAGMDRSGDIDTTDPEGEEERA